MTSVVHSMVHVAQTINDFGPVQNYSTFNFESAIGMFSKNKTYRFDHINRLILSRKQLIADS